MFIPVNYLWVIGALFAIIFIAFIVSISKRNQRISDLATMLSKALIEQAMAESKAREERLYSTAWYKSEVTKIEEKAKAEAEAYKKWREEHPDEPQTYFQRIPLHPSGPVILEREMLEKCKYAQDLEKQRDVIIEYVPKVIKSLLDMRDCYSFPDIVEQLKDDKMIDDYCTILNKYRIKGVINHIED